MCGLAGISYAVQGATSPAQARVGLEEALSAIRHRGPDDSGLFLCEQGRVGLVHTRLSIVDLSPTGHQPMASEDGRVVLVFNGEIYNFAELRAQLEERGHRFRGHSDTEVLLRLYLDQRGDPQGLAAMLRQLNGIFALALWDADRGELLLARDALGVKPLYLAQAPEVLAFASEIKALSPLVPGAGSLDEAAVLRYLTFLWCPGEATPAREIRKLGPGEAMWVRDGKPGEVLRWYQLPVFTPARKPLNDASTAIAATTEALRQAVHRQLVADVPVGAFLSGGLDSSAIVALARERQPGIHCFTIESEGGAEAGTADDLPYARRVARHLGVPLEVVRVDADAMVRALEDMVFQLDEPLADPAPLNVMFISRLAREQGTKVLLSGAGGDDLFSGYRRHRAVAMESLLGWMPRATREGLDHLAGRLDQRRPLGRRLRKLFDGAGLDGDERLVRYFSWTRREDLMALCSPSMRERVAGVDAFEPMRRFLAALPPEVPPLERLLALEQRFFLADHNLTYTDKMSMAVGVEVRVPFLDLDLVELAASLPPRLKQRGAQGKWVLKKAMEPMLPHDVIYRPKTGFGAPLRRWMRHELRPLVSELLSPAVLRGRGLFDSQAVQALVRANDDGTVDASYTLFSLMCVELWCRRFLDARDVRPAAAQAMPVA